MGNDRIDTYLVCEINLNKLINRIFFAIVFSTMVYFLLLVLSNNGNGSILHFTYYKNNDKRIPEYRHTQISTINKYWCFLYYVFMIFHVLCR
jgi:hypothetical protein